jgi:hypothetical protein
MRHITEEVTGFNGGGFSSQWTLNMDVGPTYKELVLRTNLNNDQIRQVLIQLNGDPIYDVTGEELRMVEAYKGNHQEDGVFVVPFADFSAKTQEGQDLTELVTLSGDNLNITVKTGAATAQQTTDSLVPTLKAFAVMGESKADRIVIPRMYSDLVQAGKTGKNVYKNFNRGPRIRRLHMASAAVTALEIKRNKLIRYDLDKADNDFVLKRQDVVPQANHFHFDPIATKFAKSDFLQTAGSSFEINPTVSSVGDVPVLFETVETV